MKIKEFQGELKQEAKEKYIDEIKDMQDAIDALYKKINKKSEGLLELIHKYYPETKDNNFNFEIDKLQVIIFESKEEEISYKLSKSILKHFFNGE